MTTDAVKSITIPHDLVERIETWAATHSELHDLSKAANLLIEKALTPRRKKKRPEVDLQWQAIAPGLFLERAREFFVSYQQLPRQGVMDWARYFLLSHSLELALNSYLIYHGATPSEVQDQFSHRIGDLLGACEAKGLSVDDGDIARLKCIDVVHKNFWPRYPKPDARSIPAADNFNAAQVRLLNAVAMEVIKAPMFGDLG
jgi:hypothetical protein